MAKLELKAKAALASESHTLAKGNHMVRYRSTTYVPKHFETGTTDPVPEPLESVWAPLTRDDIRKMAAHQFGTLFANDGELNNFAFMTAQNCEDADDAATSLLIRTKTGLKRLNDAGDLEDPTGEFVPNALVPVLNEDKKEKDRVFQVIQGWVDSEEEAHSLLFHLATALAPGWSAVRYVLLLGEGRNGKSVLLKMLQGLFGRENVSNITRQHIAEQSPVVTELNGKLLNIVFDGQAVYLKDSGVEKSIIAGEMVPIRKLYESTPTMVQTNALFIEGLQREPKSNDKSSALQKRLVRFQFPNIYALDHKFEKQMLNEKSLGAFLSLLIDHYVLEDEVAEKLTPTQKAMELQLEHMYVNSYALQFLRYVELTSPEGTAALVGLPISDLAQRFQSWRIRENDINTWAEPDVEVLFRQLINTERKSARMGGTVRKVRVVTSFKVEALAFIESLKGDEHDIEEDDVAALVAD